MYTELWITLTNNNSTVKPNNNVYNIRAPKVFTSAHKLLNNN
jgi:hypothetical protein